MPKRWSNLFVMDAAGVAAPLRYIEQGKVRNMLVAVRTVDSCCMPRSACARSARAI
ncbi:MAG: hypothetical protein Q4B54_02795 [Coriobacteriales bacterium]|nr:hypothetical protein [Coriobacteriales bacterium]